MAVNLTITPKPGEDGESLARRFKRAQIASGVLRDMGRHVAYFKPSDAKKHKRRMAARRRRKVEKRVAAATARRDYATHRETD
jgi:ribosomal protein S21